MCGAPGGGARAHRACRGGREGPQGRAALIRLLPTISRTFHFLFKVLFIFPSQYLFAIGLPQIFSFRWTLPPD